MYVVFGYDFFFLFFFFLAESTTLKRKNPGKSKMIGIRGR